MRWPYSRLRTRTDSPVGGFVVLLGLGVGLGRVAMGRGSGEGTAVAVDTGGRVVTEPPGGRSSSKAAPIAVTTKMLASRPISTPSRVRLRRGGEGGAGQDCQPPDGSGGADTRSG